MVIIVSFKQQWQVVVVIVATKATVGNDFSFSVVL